MSDTRQAGRTWMWIGAALLSFAVSSACAPKAARRQTEIMEKTGKVSVSAAVLRSRVNELVDRSAGRIEATADRMGADAEDDVVRGRALVLKVDAVAAIYTAGFRADPLTAAMDVWGFAFQFSQYMETGAGQSAYGPQQPLVQACARDLVADADAVMKSIAIRPEYFDRARTMIDGWARTNPVTHAFSARVSAAALAAELRSVDRDVFQTVEAVSDLIENLSERLNTYAAQLPKQARWQAEILVRGVTGKQRVEDALADVHELGTAARRATVLLDDMPGLLETERLLAAERGAVLAGVNDQRLQTLDRMSAERVAVLAAMQQERVALLASLRQERIETLIEVDAIKTRAVDSAVAGLRDLVDYAFWRVAVLLLLLMVAAAILAVIAYRLTRGRPRLQRT